MNDVRSHLKVVAGWEVELEEIFKKVSPEHRGVLFERVLKKFHPQENTRRLEKGFVEVWGELNDKVPMLTMLLHVGDQNPRESLLPKNEREWQIACLVAATVIQWLPTTIGCAFLRKAFERGGGEFSYKLPEISESDE